MASSPTRSSGLFSGLVLLTVGVLILLRNYAHIDLGYLFTHWWPVLIIFWGVIKLYERTLGRKLGTGGGAVTGGEVMLVIGMMVLLGMVVSIDSCRGSGGDEVIEVSGDDHSFDMDVTPTTVPADARVSVRLGRGSISVRASDDPQIRISAKKNARAWTENEAERLTKSVSLEVVKNGDTYEVRPTGYDISEPKISIDLDMSIPKKSGLSVKIEKGKVNVSGLAADVTIEVQNGDVDVRGIAGDVSVETRKGDVSGTDIKGDLKVSGKGGQIELNSAGGGLTVDGEFYGPIRADKVGKGVRLISAKTDLTVSALAGHMEWESGNLDLVDVPGNISLRTRDTEISLENPGGKVDIDNRNADVNVRFSSPPKDDVNISDSSAAIALSVPGSSNFDIQADCRNCDIDSEFPGLLGVKSASGDSSLAGKAGSGKGPKLVLKTSYGNISLRRISNAIPPKPPAAPKLNNVPIPPSSEQ